MATTQQEKIYNEIVEYYKYSSQLIELVEEASHDLSEEQFLIIEDVVEKLEKYADELSSKYIEFIKNGPSDKVAAELREALNNVLIRIEECRNKIKMLYSNRSSNNS